MSNITEAVTDALDLVNVGPHILQKVPTLIKRAVIDLQKMDILPPKPIEFLSGYQEEIKKDLAGNTEYSYWRMPEDFRKLEELYVGDNEKPYVHVAYENYFWTQKDKEHKRIFTVADIQIDEALVPVIIAQPFPSKSTAIRIKYHTNGTDKSLTYLNEEYHNVVIDKVMEMIGLKSPEQSENSAIEMSSTWRRRKGINRVNKTMERTKPSFFGR
jgi:hypothetical protein